MGAAHIKAHMPGANCHLMVSPQWPVFVGSATCANKLCTATSDSSAPIMNSGTPLQNNLGELWSLLNFLLPEVFSNLADFQGWFDFGTMGQEESSQEIVAAEQRNHVSEEVCLCTSWPPALFLCTGFCIKVAHCNPTAVQSCYLSQVTLINNPDVFISQVITKLHGILKPFLLRRIKADVEIDLPRKQEVLLYAPMTEQQKTINQQLLDKTLMVSGVDPLPALVGYNWHSSGGNVSVSNKCVTYAVGIPCLMACLFGSIITTLSEHPQHTDITPTPSLYHTE